MNQVAQRRVREIEIDRLLMRLAGRSQPMQRPGQVPRVAAELRGEPIQDVLGDRHVLASGDLLQDSPPGGAIGIRKDARWSVPEPELVLVINSRGRIVGYTIGNDMSSRDIEGENLLYLPQAKVYHRSCAIGPWIVVGASEAEARDWKIQLEIRRAGEVVFEGETSVGQIKRPFDELAGFLFRSQVFPHGAMLLTGTGIVPPDNFTLRRDDVVRISISGIGTLENPVTEV